MVVEAYPDKAHFIYELLQNAEDAGARHVHFKLENNRLTYWHDGRAFDLKDIESITNIGNSSKLDEVTSIGKFGIGFKAVFAYTDAPEIYSGDYSFRIRDLIALEKIESSILDKGDLRTFFVFPFGTKTFDQSVKEIASGLEELRENTLLFLNNIQKISYTLSNGKCGTIERKDKGDGIIEITAVFEEKMASSYWLRYQKEVSVRDKKGVLKTLPIALAYKMKKDEEDVWSVLPTEGKVFIFFPAEKEYSGLRFHIHAPFAPALARDSVRDCKENDSLHKELLELFRDSLPNIRDRGLLTVDFLSIMPHSKENLGRKYESFKQAAVKAFRTTRLTPTKQGTHSRAERLISGSADMIKVFSDADMKLLTGRSIPVWVANAPQRNSRADFFLHDLGIEHWSAESLNELHEDQLEILTRILQSKDKNWLIQFYQLAGSIEPSWNSYRTKPCSKFATMLSSFAVVPSSEETWEKSDDIFFVPEGKRSLPQGIPAVMRAVLGKSDEQKKKIRCFLEALGVRVYGEQAAISLRMKKYDVAGEMVSEKIHLEDVCMLLDFYKNSPRDALTLLEGKRFFLGTLDGKTGFHAAKAIYLDAPYSNTGFGELISLHRRRVCLSAVYLEKIPAEYRDIFTNFVESAGIKCRLTIKPLESLQRNPHRVDLYAKDPGTRGWATEEDYCIENQERYLNSESIAASRLLWMALIQADSSVKDASFRRTKNSTIYTEESLLVYSLRKAEWIPDREGNFHAPQKMTQEQLREDFPYDNRNGLLTAIQFGKEARERSEEHKKNQEAAEKAGFESYDMMHRLAELARRCQARKLNVCDLLEKHLKSVDSDQFPENPVRDKERRFDKAVQEGMEAPSTTYVNKTLSKRLKADHDSKTYLKEQYSNISEKLICQMCQKKMPFKLLNSQEYYFENVQLLPKIKYELKANHVALCPLCAAKYKELAQRDESTMKKLRRALEKAQGACEIEISLGDREGTASLRFSEQHIVDFQGAFEGLKGKKK